MRCVGLIIIRTVSKKGARRRELRRAFLLPRSARQGELFLFAAQGLAQPRTLRLLLPRGKSNQKRARTNGSGLLSRGRPLGGHLGGGVKDYAAGFLGRRSLRICSTPSAALALVGLRLPPFQRGTAVQGARGLTEHSSDSHLLHQIIVPSAARQPGSPAGCRDGRCREAAMTSLVRTVRRSKHRHRPKASTIDRKSKGRSVTKLPRNEGGFSRNYVP